MKQVIIHMLKRKSNTQERDVSAMHIHTTHKYPIYNMQIIIKKIIINNKWLLRNCDKDLYRVGHFTVDKLLSCALTVQPFLLLIRQQIFVKS